MIRGASLMANTPFVSYGFAEKVKVAHPLTLRAIAIAKKKKNDKIAD